MKTEEPLLSSGIIALFLLATLKAKIESSPLAITEVINKLKRKGIKIGEIDIQRTAGGYTSNRLEQFIGVSLLEGNLSNRSPILITPEGYNNFKNMVHEIPVSEIKLIADAIGMKVPI